MAEEIIKCPNCGFEIPISEALTRQIRNQLKSESEAEVIAEKQRLNEVFKEEKNKLLAEAEKKAGEKLGVELSDLKNQLDEKNKKIDEAQKMELELRKQQRELEESKKALELEVARKLDAEREKIKQEALAQAAEENRFKFAELEKQNRDLQKSLEEAQRKASQGSMQLQGEVLELDLEEILKSTFPFDEIKEVPKGIRGADVIHTVYDSSHAPSGVILWEAKRTKNWSDAWLQKLKDDQREIGADIAVIVSEVMPKGVNKFGLVEGVWVTKFSLAMAVGTALRQQLMEVAFARQGAVGKGEKMDMLYEYLSGSEFRQRIEAIVETFSGMQMQLEKEKRAMAKIWKEREKQIQRITTNTSQMYGAMRGIIGASLPEVELLELGPVESRQLEEGLESEE
ncbi:MAG: DUF2130 domain-containing protein [Dehalococcoidia bacterium]